MGKLKGLRKKENLIGTIAGVTAIAAPLLMVPVQSSYAENLIGIVPDNSISVDAIQTIVLPLNSTKYIDFETLYRAVDFNVISFGTSTSGNFAFDGSYEIKANNIGTATFTVTGRRLVGDGAYDEVTDTFRVIVVQNSSENPNGYNFDISNVYEQFIQLPQESQTKTQIKDLLRNITPNSVVIREPYSYNNDNSAPFQIYPSSSYFSGKLGVPINSWEIQQQINNYFNDNDVYYPEGSEEGQWDQISLVSIESNADFNVTPYYEGDRNVDYTIIPLHDGDVNLDVVVSDHKGGFTKGQIPIHIDPIFKSNSVLVNHFQSPGLNNPVLYLSNDAMIDLNEIFYDVEENTMRFELFAEFQVGSSDFVDRSINLNSANVFSWQTLGYLNEYPVKIKQILAYDNKNTNMPPTVINVDIEHTQKDPFPSSLDMYQSVSGVGTSSFILDYQSARGFNDGSITINSTDIQNYATGTVTASVYQNHYLKFDAGVNTKDWITKLKVYAHDSNPAHLYLDDFNFKIVSAAQTPAFDLNPAIQINHLYPTDQNNDTVWGNVYTHINNYVITNTATNIRYDYSSGALTATYESSEGTNAILKIDPFNGTSVFIVPFKKNDIPG